jgi:hypothetical protein
MVYLQLKIFEKEILAQDEFFAELRLKGVSQLGQIQEAIEEVSGDISIFYYRDEEVKYGLPILPDSLEGKQTEIQKENYYACIFCGCTQLLTPAVSHSGVSCGKKECVVASDKKRIT